MESNKLITFILYALLIVSGINLVMDISGKDFGFSKTKINEPVANEQIEPSGQENSKIKTDEPAIDEQNEVSSSVVCNNSEYKLIEITEPLMPEQCEASKQELGIVNCTRMPDYWAKAVLTCGGKQKMANDDDLAKIANDVYGVNYIEGRTNNSSNLKMNKDTYKQYFCSEKVRGVWSSDESTGKYTGRSHWRYFWNNATGWRGNGVRENNTETNHAFCK